MRGWTHSDHGTLSDAEKARAAPKGKGGLRFELACSAVGTTDCAEAMLPCRENGCSKAESS